MAESKTEQRINERFDQTISPEDLEAFGVQSQCVDCPRLAYEYCQRRNETTDATFRHVSLEFNQLSEAIRLFQSPTSPIDEDQLEQLLSEYSLKIANYHKEHPFKSEFAGHLEELGMPSCDGLIEFDAAQPYIRRYTRDAKGLPLEGEALAVCQQDTQYVRDSKGYADLALVPMKLRD